MNIEEIRKAISGNDFNKFIGQTENNWIDFKSGPYILETDRQKIEFAKDVSSFANSEGGFILIGLKTKEDDEGNDKVRSISPIPKNSVNTNQYKAIIRSWIIPRVDCEVYWAESYSDQDEGIIVITIPEQNKFPYLVIKTLEEEKIIGHFFGYFQRNGDGINHHEVEDMYFCFRQGFFMQEEKFSGTKNPEEIQERADEIRTDDSLPEEK